MTPLIFLACGASGGIVALLCLVFLIRWQRRLHGKGDVVGSIEFTCSKCGHEGAFVRVEAVKPILGDVDKSPNIDRCADIAIKANAE